MRAFLIALVGLAGCVEDAPGVPDLTSPSGCANGVLDGDETDVDCGGSTCGPCALDKMCLAALDCVSRDCVNNVCVAAPPDLAGPRDLGGLDLTATDLAPGTPDLAAPDLATPDLAIVGDDLAPSPGHDLAISSDFAVPPDLAAGPDLTPRPDLAPPSDLEPPVAFVPQASNTLRDLYGIWGRGREYFVVGDFGTILHTGDSGKSWAPLPSGTQATLGGIWGNGQGDLWAVSNALSGPLHSSNGGAAWALQDTGYRFGGFSAVWATGSEVWLVGGVGLTYHSLDAGQHWTAVAAFTNQNLYCVGGSLATDVFVGGTGGAIFHSADHGATWIQQASNTNLGLYGAWSLVGGGGTTSVVAGDVGRVRISTNGGAWQTRDIPSIATFYGVWGSSALDLYAVGTIGALQHTTDGANSWTAAGGANMNTLRAIWGSGPTDVIAVGLMGTILHSP